MRLAPKSFELLALLVDHRPRALSKEELLERVWPGVFVSDASLAKVVSKIRKAIGDDDASPVIRTVHGYGYAVRRGDRRTRRGNACFTPRAGHVLAVLRRARVSATVTASTSWAASRDANICLDSPNVSRRHARLVVHGGARNARRSRQQERLVRRAGIRITGPTPLESGDEACIGPFRLLFRCRC